MSRLTSILNYEGALGNVFACLDTPAAVLRQELVQLWGRQQVKRPATALKVVSNTVWLNWEAEMLVQHLPDAYYMHTMLACCLIECFHARSSFDLPAILNEADCDIRSGDGYAQLLPAADGPDTRQIVCAGSTSTFTASAGSGVQESYGHRKAACTGIVCQSQGCAAKLGH